MIQRMTVNAIFLVRRYMPAPYLFALVLTFVAAILAMTITRTPPSEVVDYWYRGLWDILTFTMQMVLVLMCGHALVDAPLVKRGLDWFSTRPKTERQAGVLVFLIGWATALFNWGFCLVVVGVMVREIPRRLPGVSKGYLAAAGYTGFAVWASGLSSSIALVTATAGSPLNIIDLMAHQTFSLRETLWTPYNIFGVAGMLVLMPLLFWRIPISKLEPQTPAPEQPPSPIEPSAAEGTAPAAERTPAEKIEQSRVVTFLLVLMGMGYVYTRFRQGTFHLDLNMMIFLLFVLGWILHVTPIRYMQAFHAGARAAGPLVLAYPLYGGIMGLMRDTGLADWFAQLFVSFSTAETLPFWSFVSSNVINLFVPSGGGQWAVQGPVMVKAAIELDASLPKTAMAVAFGDQTSNLLQPFWALPIVSIAAVSVREMMGYCLVALAIAFPLFGAALLIF
ncbi:MAG: short-chain fatty acid transporter [Acidobacteria bacterium]|nr:short-chain fatty acid transporter [Acidobacteriota bacterium]